MDLKPEVIGAALIGAALFGWFASEKGASKKEPIIKDVSSDAPPKKVAPKVEKPVEKTE